jgi:hydrogenase maturation protein HypF
MSSSAGRLFDTAAALLGFTHAIDYEGQAASWLEQLAWLAAPTEPLPFDVTPDHLDFRPALQAMIRRRLEGDDQAALARAFHETIVAGISAMTCRLCDEYGVETVVLSGGTFQNALLVDRLRSTFPRALRLWTNQQVPPNDGGISLGQAAFAAFELDNRARART